MRWVTGYSPSDSKNWHYRKKGVLAGTIKSYDFNYKSLFFSNCSSIIKHRDKSLGSCLYVYNPHRPASPSTLLLYKPKGIIYWPHRTVTENFYSSRSGSLEGLV